jgi:hypothetical protein
MDQNLDVFLLKVLPPPGMSRCVALDISQSKKIFKSFAVPSYLCVVVALQDEQRQRWEPAAVLPKRVILPLHTGHLEVFMLPK